MYNFFVMQTNTVVVVDLVEDVCKFPQRVLKKFQRNDFHKITVRLKPLSIKQ